MQAVNNPCPRIKGWIKTEQRRMLCPSSSVPSLYPIRSARKSSARPLSFFSSFECYRRNHNPSLPHNPSDLLYYKDESVPENLLSPLPPDQSVKGLPSYSTILSKCQISFTYSSIVRSEENFPAWAVFKMAAFAHHSLSLKCFTASSSARI